MPRVSLPFPPAVLPMDSHGDGSAISSKVGGPKRNGVRLVKQSRAFLFDRSSPCPLKKTDADLLDPSRDVGTLQPSQPIQPPPDGNATRRQEAGQAVSFGIDLTTLAAQKEKGAAAFSAHCGLAKELQEAKAKKTKYYEETVKIVVDRDGKPRERTQVVRIRKNRIQRFESRHAKNGAAVQKAFNLISERVRKFVGTPRKTGSNYLSTHGTEGLVTVNKILPLENAGAAHAGMTQGNRIVGPIAGSLNQPGIAAGSDIAGGTLSVAAPVLAGVAAAVATTAVVAIKSEREDAKTKVLRDVDAAKDFWEFLASASAEDADAFLDFDEAANKLFGPKSPDMKAAEANAVNQMAIGLPASVTSGATGITSLAAPAIAIVGPGIAAVSVLGAIGGAFEAYIGNQEFQSQTYREAQARQRKEAMNDVLANSLNDLNEKQKQGVAVTPEAWQAHLLLEGIVTSLIGWQDRVIDHAKREQVFARLHIGTGGATVGGMTALAAAGVVVATGIIAAPILGPAAPIAATAGLVWAGASAKRSNDQHRIEHRQKWRRRAARDLGLLKHRGELEAKLAGTHPEGAGLQVHFQEGEYLPEKDRFAGSRQMNFNARDNEYLGLRVLALEVQDLILGKTGYNPDSPFFKLLEAIGIDAVRLLAICKAASGRPAHAQLDCIQSRIASRLDMKLPMEGEVQPLLHVSRFIEHFASARRLPERLEGLPEGLELFQGIREELVDRFYKADPQAGLRAFDTAIRTFLAKVDAKKLPDTELLKMLRGFSAYLAPRVQADGLVAELEQFNAKKKAAREEPEEADEPRVSTSVVEDSEASKAWFSTLHVGPGIEGF